MTKMHEDAGDGVCANCPWCDANLDYGDGAAHDGACAWCGHPDVVQLQAKVERLRGTCEWQLENDRKSAESIARLLAETKRLQAALRQILEDPDAQILDSHRDDGWAALSPLG